MMKNKDLYAVAVRRPNGEIAVQTKEYAGILHDHLVTKIPFVRGIFNFIDSLALGVQALNKSAEYFEEEEDQTKDENKKPGQEKKKKTLDKISSILTIIIAIALCVGLFIFLPFYLSGLLSGVIRNESVVNVLEGVIRIVIFLIYVLLISLMKDIRRTYMYHGAEHKCINCLERGRALTVSNVRRSSRLHKRCGTSFLLFVMLVSVVLFFFIRIDNQVYKLLLRVALIPVVAGISYELIRLAGKTDNIFTKILSAPGFLLQKITTKEPDEDMIEVAIASVEAVFDWKRFLKTEFEVDPDVSDDPNLSYTTQWDPKDLNL
ncbi:MAG: DUF1385 domain-containing protein [Lachnospiraceae bacterium]|nr:DUF1385 domain-containing protein [Candidatus Merdinaster equi]